MTKAKSKKKGKKSKKRRIVGPVIWLLLILVPVLLAYLGFYFQIGSKLNFSPDLPPDPDTPFSAPFVIENAGVWPIENVKIATGVTSVIAGDDYNRVQNLTLADATPPVPIIDSNEKTTVLLPFFIKFNYPITFADIAIKIDYSYKYFWILPVSKTQHVRFVTRINSAKTLQWYPLAVSQERGDRK
jgi:hypothetical protein